MPNFDVIKKIIRYFFLQSLNWNKNFYEDEVDEPFSIAAELRRSFTRKFDVLVGLKSDWVGDCGACWLSEVAGVVETVGLPRSKPPSKSKRSLLLTDVVAFGVSTFPAEATGGIAIPRSLVPKRSSRALWNSFNNITELAMMEFSILRWQSILLF